jgi:putative peptidoglycan lipid II flippase
VALTASLGYLFAFPLRPLIAWIISGLLQLPAPDLEDTALVFGSVGLTSSAGIAGWVEYLLLRAAMEKRIGRIRIGSAYYVRLWGSALLAGGVTSLVLRFAVPLLHEINLIRVSWLPIFDGICALAVFAAVYLPATLRFGIEEAERFLTRGRLGKTMLS